MHLLVGVDARPEAHHKLIDWVQKTKINGRGIHIVEFKLYDILVQEKDAKELVSKLERKSNGWLRNVKIPDLLYKLLPLDKPPKAEAISPNDDFPFKDEARVYIKVLGVKPDEKNEEGLDMI